MMKKEMLCVMLVMGCATHSAVCMESDKVSQETGKQISKEFYYIKHAKEYEYYALSSRSMVTYRSGSYKNIIKFRPGKPLKSPK